MRWLSSSLRSSSVSDPKRPHAKAALAKDGTFAFIGDAAAARELVCEGTQVLDYGDNFIYPGFLESHCHGYFAGDRAIGQADLSGVVPTDYDKYREIIGDFIRQNPEREVYMAAGWTETDQYVSKAYLDEICSDKPLIMNTGGGHSMLHNTKALEWMGYDAEYAKRMGPELVHVDENDEPDGYVSEMAAISVVNKLPSSIEQAKSYLLAWQDMTLANGFTAVADAGVDLNYKDNAQAYYALEQEGKLKLRTYGYMYVPDNAENPEAEVARIAQDRARYSGEYFEIVGVKAFLDGVTEAHTAWQNEDYADEPGYHGVERFSDHDKMVRLIVAANAEGMPVHVHSEGGGATHFMLDCIEDTEKVTGNLDHVVFHSDCPISTQMDVSRSVYMAETRALVDGGMVTQRNPSEAIDREQSLKAMTINVARAWRQEDRMGSIEFGKLANMAVFDCNFPHDDLDKVARAKVIATIVDGEEVYRA